jgi:hypothetical protein
MTSHLATVVFVTSGRMAGVIAGDPKLIEPMDGSAGIRSSSWKAAMLAGLRGPWMLVDD